jgi:hypothetical protein
MFSRGDKKTLSKCQPLSPYFRQPHTEELDRIEEHEDVRAQVQQCGLNGPDPALERGEDPENMDDADADNQVLLDRTIGASDAVSASICPISTPTLKPRMLATRPFGEMVNSWSVVARPNP